MKEKFLDEYSSDDAVKKYTKETAGYGITYLLENIYGQIYLNIVNELVKKEDIIEGLRLLEFGCGAGMNLIFLLNLLENHNIKVDVAYGSDFSEKLIESAKMEANKILSDSSLKKVNFYVASNENLHKELSDNLGSDQSDISNSFHFVFGINTFRYCHRLKKEKECARNIFNLLVRGGSCVIIDMNAKYPLFRSAVSDRLTKPKEEYYLPSLDEYVEPFESTGFEIITKKNFCWIPHSAKGITFNLCKLLTPILDKLVPNYAMRSLVIARKPL